MRGKGQETLLRLHRPEEGKARSLKLRVSSRPNPFVYGRSVEGLQSQVGMKSDDGLFVKKH